MGYKIDNNTTCDTTQCAAYSHQKLRDAGYKSSGNAWDSKAKVIYNGWANTTGSDYNTHGVAAAKDFYQNFDSTTLDPEVTYEVNMYYKNSPMAEEAYPDTDGNGLRGTHTGNLYWDPDQKKWIVEHNVHGTIYRDEWFNLQKKGARGSQYGITGLQQPRKKILGIFDTGGEMNYINYYKSGSGIHIKKANKGKFTDYCGGKVTSECIARGKHSASAAVRKRATFAANARKWKHEDGGILKASWGDKFVSWKDNVVESTRNNKERLKKLFTKDDNFDEIKNPFEQEQVTPQASSTPETLTWDDLNAAFDTPIQTPQQSSVSTLNNDRMKLAINYLVSKGLSKAGAAGAVGVFFAESGLTPGRTNEDEERKYGDKAGKGIAQWSNERRKGYDEYMKGKQGTLEDELDYFLQEVATSRPKVLDVLKNASDVNEAVQAMHLGYENGTAEAFATPEQLTKIYTPAWEKLGYGKYNYQDSHNKRYGYAQTAYALV